MSDNRDDDGKKREHVPEKMAPDTADRPDAMNAGEAGPSRAGDEGTADGFAAPNSEDPVKGTAEGTAARNDGTKAGADASDNDERETEAGDNAAASDNGGKGPGDASGGSGTEPESASGGSGTEPENATGGSGTEPENASANGRADTGTSSDIGETATWDGSHRPKKPNRHGVQIWKGIGLCALLHLLPLVFPAAYIAIGIVQFVYVIPALIVCRNNTGMVQGLLIGAGITFLLNAACFGYVISFGSV